MSIIQLFPNYTYYSSITTDSINYGREVNGIEDAIIFALMDYYENSY